NPDGKTKIRKSALIAKGFNFSFYTNTYKTRNGSTYYFCYDQGYLPLEGDYLALVMRQSYVN
ncbi:MAG: hypothetical protein AAGB22_13345, partial [Bacteroidota bacterium]